MDQCCARLRALLRGNAGVDMPGSMSGEHDSLLPSTCRSLSQSVPAALCLHFRINASESTFLSSAVGVYLLRRARRILPRALRCSYIPTSCGRNCLYICCRSGAAADLWPPSVGPVRDGKRVGKVRLCEWKILRYAVSFYKTDGLWVQHRMAHASGKCACHSSKSIIPEVGVPYTKEVGV